MVKENSADPSKLPETDKKTAEEAILSAKKVLENKDAEASVLEAEVQKLQEATHKITAELYKNAGAAQGGAGGANPGAEGAAPGAEKKDDDVIDADYKDVN